MYNEAALMYVRADVLFIETEIQRLGKAGLDRVFNEVKHVRFADREEKLTTDDRHCALGCSCGVHGAERPAAVLRLRTPRAPLGRVNPPRGGRERVGPDEQGGAAARRGQQRGHASVRRDLLYMHPISLDPKVGPEAGDLTGHQGSTSHLVRLTRSRRHATPCRSARWCQIARSVRAR